jgi:glycerophosphoryl diester phosphodiesterase
MTPATTLICAHRGASAQLPDNSLAAFEAAVALGADMIEADVRLAGDTLVLSHDPAPAGSTPVRLDDLVRLAAGRIALDLEVKEAGYEQRVLDAVDPRPAGLILTSFLPDALARLRELDPTVTTGLLIGPHDHGGDLPSRAAACGAQLLCPHASQVTDALRSTAARSRPLVVWTVNESRALDGMLRDPAVGCVITDVPGVALAIRDVGLSGQPPARA